MLLGPVVILICGILLIVLSEKPPVRVIYSRLVDPITCCFLFLSYLLMISIPSMSNMEITFFSSPSSLVRDVMHLVLQANPCNMKLDQMETLLRESVRYSFIRQFIFLFHLGAKYCQYS